MPPLRKYSSSFTVSMRQSASKLKLDPSARVTFTLTVTGTNFIPGAQVRWYNQAVTNVVTVTACTKPLQMPFYTTTGFVVCATKYVPNRDRPIAFVLPGLN